MADPPAAVGPPGANSTKNHCLVSCVTPPSGWVSLRSAATGHRRAGAPRQPPRAENGRPMMQPVRATPLTARLEQFASNSLFLVAAVAAAWLMVSVPYMLQTNRVAHDHRVLEMEAGDRALCAKWGMASGSPRHLACLADLGALRTRAQQD